MNRVLAASVIVLGLGVGLYACSDDDTGGGGTGPGGAAGGAGGAAGGAGGTAAALCDGYPDVKPPTMTPAATFCAKYMSVCGFSADTYKDETDCEAKYATASDKGDCRTTHLCNAATIP